MIILLRNEMFNNKAKRKACAIRTHHVEFFPDRVEIIYPYGGISLTSQSLRRNKTLSGVASTPSA